MKTRHVFSSEYVSTIDKLVRVIRDMGITYNRNMGGRDLMLIDTAPDDLEMIRAKVKAFKYITETVTTYDKTGNEVNTEVVDYSAVKNQELNVELVDLPKHLNDKYGKQLALLVQHKNGVRVSRLISYGEFHDMNPKDAMILPVLLAQHGTKSLILSRE